MLVASYRCLLFFFCFLFVVPRFPPSWAWLESSSNLGGLVAGPEPLTATPTGSLRSGSPIVQTAINNVTTVNVLTVNRVFVRSD